MRVPRYLSPLRYPGGKRHLAPLVARAIRANCSDGATYWEPFAGGASVALSLLFRGVVGAISINDLDLGIYSFWYSVLHHPEELCRLISRRRVSKTEWFRQKAIHSSPEQHSVLEHGFATFFLNRTNRSGIISSGGMIGGVGQRGDWTITSRYNKPELILRIERIAKRADCISIFNEDGAELLANHRPTVGDFVYADPPYIVKGVRRLYLNSCGEDDHRRIRNAMAGLKSAWMVSYDDTVLARRLYTPFRWRPAVSRYTAAARVAGAELLFFSPGFRMPRLHNLDCREFSLGPIRYPRSRK